MRLTQRLLLLAVLLAALVPATHAAEQLTLGKNYRLIDPPQPTDSGKKIEVIEFFWYGCPYCNLLQPSLKAWLKRKPEDVEFRRVPAVLADSWVPLTRAYYALDAMGLEDKLHEEVYAAIHEKNVRLSDPRVLFDWVARRGIDREKFMDTYRSFGVQSWNQRSIEMTRNYDVPGTPALTIDGRYLTAPSMTLKPDNTADYERFFQVVDQLIATARKARAGK